MMKTKHYTLAMLLGGTFYHSQDKISMKNGQTLEAKVIEVGPSNVTYKSLENPDGPLRSIDRNEIYEITYANHATEVLGKYKTTDEVKNFIVSKINEYGIDRDRKDLSLRAEFEGNNVKINSVNMKGRAVKVGDWWDLSKVVAFHDISRRKDNIAYLNIVTYKITKSKRELSKLVIKITDYQAAADLLEAMKDLNIMLKKD